jgi:predicted DNA-binding transcriptional regulator AlpA
LRNFFGEPKFSQFFSSIYHATFRRMRKTKHTQQKPAKRSKKTYIPGPLPETGFVRLPQVLSVIPVAASSWWLGVKEGRYPKPVKLGPRTTAWRVEDIRRLIDTGAAA